MFWVLDKKTDTAYICGGIKAIHKEFVRYYAPGGEAKEEKKYLNKLYNHFSQDKKERFVDEKRRFEDEYLRIEECDIKRVTNEKKQK